MAQEDQNCEVFYNTLANLLGYLNFVDIHYEDFFTLNNVIKTLGNSLKLLMPNSTVNDRADFFSVRIILAWNKL